VVMYVCIYCVFCRYANHELRKLVSLELTMGMSATATDDSVVATSARREYVLVTYATLSIHVRLIYWANFSFGAERIGPTYVMILHMHAHEGVEL
jgi:hypothetical protein